VTIIYWAAFALLFAGWLALALWALEAAEAQRK
jgi:hypothetical protein